MAPFIQIPTLSVSICLFQHENSKITHVYGIKHIRISLLVFVLFKNENRHTHKFVCVCIHMHTYYLHTNLSASIYPPIPYIKILTAWNLAWLNFFYSVWAILDNLLTYSTSCTEIFFHWFTHIFPLPFPVGGPYTTFFNPVMWNSSHKGHFMVVNTAFHEVAQAHISRFISILPCLRYFASVIQICLQVLA